MADMDVFNSDAFNTFELTTAIEEMDFVPQYLGSLDIFESVPTYSRTIGVEKKGNALSLIPTSPLASPPRETKRDPRTIQNLNTVRLADSFTLYAYEVDGIRAFGTQTELESVQVEYAGRMSKVRTNMDLTHEFHRMGALQGKLLDSDGASVIYDYFAEFGIPEPAEIDFELNLAATNVRQKCHELTRSMARSSKGAFTAQTQVHALCGDSYFDQLVGHDNVVKTYENWASAADLRENLAFQSFPYGGVLWHNYRGTDDESTIAVPTEKAKFFPVGAQGVFQKAQSPAEFGPWVNTRGEDTYALNIVDRDREAWSKGELYSYPLYICARPETLRNGTAS